MRRAPGAAPEWQDEHRVAGLDSVVSSHELAGECLRDGRTFIWGGTTRWAYQLTD